MVPKVCEVMEQVVFFSCSAYIMGQLLSRNYIGAIIVDLPETIEDTAILCKTTLGSECHHMIWQICLFLILVFYDVLYLYYVNH